MLRDTGSPSCPTSHLGPIPIWTTTDTHHAHVTGHLRRSATPWGVLVGTGQRIDSLKKIFVESEGETMGS